jgi:hypothetical protein
VENIVNKKNRLVICYTSFVRHHFVARVFLEHDERSEECYKANKCDKMAYKTSIIQFFFNFVPIFFSDKF